MRGFFLHLFVYVAVNALLIVVNLLYMPNYYWFLFPLIGWGLLVLAHAYVTFYRKHGRASLAPLELEQNHEEVQALVRHRRWRTGALR